MTPKYSTRHSRGVQAALVMVQGKNETLKQTNKRLLDGIYAVVANLVNDNPDSALTLALVVMYGGSANNPLDCADPKHNKKA